MQYLTSPSQIIEWDDLVHAQVDNNLAVFSFERKSFPRLWDPRLDLGPDSA